MQQPTTPPTPESQPLHHPAGSPLDTAPHDPHAPGIDPSLVPPPAKTPLPQSVVILGVIAVALLIVVIAISAGAGKKGSSSRNGSGSDDSSATASADGKDTSLKGMQAEIQLLKENNDRIRAGMGLTPTSEASDIESADKVAVRIRTDTATLTALAKKASEMIGSKDAELTARNKLLNESQQAQKALSDQIVALRQELNGVSRQNIDASSLQAQLQSAMTKVNELSQQVQDLRIAPADLQKRLGEVTQQRDYFERQARELQAKLAKINIFAGSEADIMKEAQALYHSLVSLEGQAQAEISRAYSQYATALGSTTLDKIAFATGSSELGPDDLAKLRTDIEQSPDNAFFFVVGYASKTGSVDDNRKLSSARATAVATALADLKKPGQRVQAAYLGQTDRFGPTADPNQICELWQIVPRE